MSNASGPEAGGRAADGDERDAVEDSYEASVDEAGQFLNLSGADVEESAAGRSTGQRQ